MSMHIYFDLDGTLVDENGESLRPGIRTFLDTLCANAIMLSLWTASTEERAVSVLDEFNLRTYFTNIVAREHYDPYAEGYGKDIRYLDGDILIDNDPKHIEFAQSIGKQGFLLSTYVKGTPVDSSEIEEILRDILDYWCNN